MSQWAEMLTMALGAGMVLPNARQPRDQGVSSMAFMGLPWPTKSTGIRAEAVMVCSRLDDEAALGSPPAATAPPTTPAPITAPTLAPKKRRLDVVMLM